MARITARAHNYSDQLLAYAGVRVALPQDKDRVAGPFQIQTTANTTAVTATISGSKSAGVWDLDHNLNAVMPTDGDFWWIITGFESYVENTAGELGEDLSVLDAQSYLSHTPSGGIEKRYHATGSLHARGVAQKMGTDADTAGLDGPGRPVVLPYAAVVSNKNDTLTYVSAAVAGLSEAKNMQVMIHGFALKATVWSPDDSRFVLTGSKDAESADKLAFTRAMFQRWGGRGVRLFNSLFA